MDRIKAVAIQRVPSIMPIFHVAGHRRRNQAYKDKKSTIGSFSDPAMS